MNRRAVVTVAAEYVKATAGSVTVRLNGRDITPTFRPAVQAGSLIGLVTGLQVGSNTLQASIRGRREAVEAAIVNHAISGPVEMRAQAGRQERFHDAGGREIVSLRA